jgi:hypothetical protein
MQTVQPQECGLDAAQLDRFMTVVSNDIERKQVVARGGQVALHEAIGFAERETARPAQAAV